MKFNVGELEVWQELDFFNGGETLMGFFVKWIITGFEKEIHVAEETEGNGYLFLKEDENDPKILVVVEDSKEYEKYIRVMIEYREIKKREKSEQREYLN